MPLGQWLRRRKRNRWAVDRLHQGILAQALKPEFYANGLARDNFSGRFEMTALHAALAFRRLRELGPAGQDLAQEAFDALFDGFDEALRDIGTGDLSVGKKIRKMGEAFYGRARAYDAALAPGAGADDLVAALDRNVGAAADRSRQLADYARLAADQLARHAPEMLLTGELRWPKPPAATRTP
jgi:cytochrome b pre-mRNA-processing protein 3